MSMGQTANLLVELFVEELPPKALKSLGEAFANALQEGLSAQGLVAEGAQATAFASPRRLGLHLTNVRARAEDKAVNHKLMPASVGLAADGSATPALLKKLAALGADASALPRLQRQGEGKAETLFLPAVRAGVALAEGLQQALTQALGKLPIPKVMSYQLADGWSSVQFVRPAHGLLALHGREVLPCSALGLHSGRSTQGHRFEALEAVIDITDADAYETTLRERGGVIARFSARREELLRQLHAAAAKEGLRPIEDDALVDEVTALVENPNVLLCRFDEAFLGVPPECLILTMKANQKYFPLLDAQGQLTNRFLVVSNIRPADASAVIEGNERVVRPRLADAKFFFDQDRKRTLESRLPGLDKVVYHARLGSMGERVQRVVALAGYIGDHLGGAVLAQQARRAAQLAKADLLSDMVGEFPELQGQMGGHYARHDGEPEAVAIAIEDHYRPRFAGDALPRNEAGLCVALADKLETLAGLFSAGEKPTGDKDPFALRRHALGVIRILSERGLDVDLRAALGEALRLFPDPLQAPEDGRRVPVPPTWDLQDFIEDRASSYLKDMGYAVSEVAAVVSVTSCPAEYLPRLKAVRKVREMAGERFDALAQADKRARNIINKSRDSSGGALLANRQLFVEPAETSLLNVVEACRTGVETLARRKQFEEALLLTMEVSEPVTAFFAEVMVNSEDPDIRENRFNLLHQLVGLTNRVAYLHKLAA
jgi:glycyl-tRNA synthetase beta chain